MNPVLTEVIEYLESCDCKPTIENIKRTLNKWIKNLYSHIGKETHKHLLGCGIVDETGMTWEEQDMQMLQQIKKYRQCLLSIKE